MNACCTKPASRAACCRCPQAQRHSHCFDAVLPRQFDELVWFDQTHAVTPLKTEELEVMPETYPFGL